MLLWERAPLYRSGKGNPVAWAVALARNKAIDRLRSCRRRSEVMGIASEEPALNEGPGSSPTGPWASGTSDDSAVRALHTLPQPQREAIELAFLSGLTQQEIAQRLGQPLGTIKARIRRGLLTLRDVLEEQS